MICFTPPIEMFSIFRKLSTICEFDCTKTHIDKNGCLSAWWNIYLERRHASWTCAQRRPAHLTHAELGFRNSFFACTAKGKASASPKGLPSRFLCHSLGNNDPVPVLLRQPGDGRWSKLKFSPKGGKALRQKMASWSVSLSLDRVSN